MLTNVIFFSQIVKLNIFVKKKKSTGNVAD